MLLRVPLETHISLNETDNPPSRFSSAPSSISDAPGSTHQIDRAADVTVHQQDQAVHQVAGGGEGGGAERTQVSSTKVQLRPVASARTPSDIQQCVCVCDDQV